MAPSRINGSLPAGSAERQSQLAGTPLNAQNLQRAASEVSRAPSASSRSSVQGWQQKVEEVPVVPGRNAPPHVSKTSSHTQPASAAGGPRAPPPRTESATSSRHSARSRGGRGSQHHSTLQPVPENQEAVHPAPGEEGARQPAVHFKPPSRHSSRSRHSKQHEATAVVEAGEQAVSEINSAHESRRSSKNSGKPPTKQPSHRGSGESSNRPWSANDHDQQLAGAEPVGGQLSETQGRGGRHRLRGTEMWIQQSERVADEEGTVYNRREEIRIRDPHKLKGIPGLRRRWHR